MKKTISSIIFLILFLFSFGVVNAESTITAIPPKLVIEAMPGETVKAVVKVRNESKEMQNYSIFVSDFVVNDLDGTPIPISENVTSRWSLRKWIIAPTFLPVDSGVTRSIELLIRVPSSALPGGHYAMITYMPNAEIRPGELKKTATIIGQRVGTLIYVTIKGKITEKANITSFTVPKFLEQGPVDFAGSFENLSDVHILPKGEVLIYDFLDKEVARLPLEIGNIFPDSSKRFVTTWDNRWGYGKYKAVVNINYGSVGNVESATIFFWLFPIRLTIYLLVVLVSVLVVIILLEKRNKRHQNELESELVVLKKEIEDLEKR